MERPQWFEKHEEDDQKNFERTASKELVLEQFKQVHEKLDDMKESGDKTLEQTKKTNGRVSKLERYQTGLVMCTAVITFLVIPLLVAYFTVSNSNLKSEILNEVKK